ncbi:hypothetical protein GCM10011512_10010 [Tersicoccus solisilvae]|uniref:DUF6314 domain-containing protein n=2 Tax=Tersicoccus solisilvae TaxID=1882339 RepID=A0ABQ1P1T9_9MICC|nr:hypothetical protein GCM10011512_10010 [Tersicoccus solisilvae]
MTEPLRYLAGAWSFERRLDDRRAGRVYTVTGSAVFGATSEESTIAYAETGSLTGDGQPPAAVERRLTWHDEGDARVLIRFADGREYLRLDFGSGHAEGNHPCAPDTYLVTLTAEDDDAWTETWDVTGPAKDYTAVTRYTRHR